MDMLNRKYFLNWATAPRKTGQCWQWEPDADVLNFCLRINALGQEFRYRTILTMEHITQAADWRGLVAQTLRDLRRRFRAKVSSRSSSTENLIRRMK